MNEGSEIIHVNEVRPDIRLEERPAHGSVSVRSGIMEGRPPISVNFVGRDVVIQAEIDEPEHSNHSGLVEARPGIDVIHEVKIKEVRSNGQDEVRELGRRVDHGLPQDPRHVRSPTWLLSKDVRVANDFFYGRGIGCLHRLPERTLEIMKRPHGPTLIQAQLPRQDEIVGSGILVFDTP